MPALNFSKFIAAVEDGSKPLTIRDIRKNPIRPGDVLYMFTGMRTRQCRKLNLPPISTAVQKPDGKTIISRSAGNARVCRAVIDLKFESNKGINTVSVIIGNMTRNLSANEERNLCHLDGFDYVSQFWEYHAPYAKRMASQMDGNRPFAERKEMYIYGELPPGPFRSMLEMYAPDHVRKSLGI